MNVTTYNDPSGRWACIDDGDWRVSVWSNRSVIVSAYGSVSAQIQGESTKVMYRIPEFSALTGVPIDIEAVQRAIESCLAALEEAAA